MKVLQLSSILASAILIGACSNPPDSSKDGFQVDYTLTIHQNQEQTNSEMGKAWTLELEADYSKFEDGQLFSEPAFLKEHQYMKARLYIGDDITEVEIPVSYNGLFIDYFADITPLYDVDFDQIVIDVMDKETDAIIYTSTLEKPGILAVNKDQLQETYSYSNGDIIELAWQASTLPQDPTHISLWYSPEGEKDCFISDSIDDFEMTSTEGVIQFPVNSLVLNDNPDLAGGCDVTLTITKKVSGGSIDDYFLEDSEFIHAYRESISFQIFP